MPPQVEIDDEMVIAIHLSYVKNMAETFLSIVECRICKFLEKFSDKKTPKNIRWWIEGFAGFTNYWTAKR